MNDLLRRLTDRSFMGTIATAVGSVAACYAIWQTSGVPVTDKINATLGAMVAVATVVSIFTHSEKAKDKAAITAQLAPPQNVNIGTAQNVDASTPVASTPATNALQPEAVLPEAVLPPGAMVIPPGGYELKVAPVSIPRPHSAFDSEIAALDINNRSAADWTDTDERPVMSE